MNKSVIEKSKNCKNGENNMKNAIKNNKICKNNAFLSKEDFVLYVWVKTLVLAYNALPNIINLVDKMVCAKASSATDGSLIFADYKYGTYGQIEELLDLQERKLSLINLHTMIEKMVDSLSEKHKQFVSLKFYKKKSAEYIAEELEMDERTAFRWSKVVLLKLVEFCKKNNWTENFILNQIQREYWLKEQYQKQYQKLANRFGILQ